MNFYVYVEEFGLTGVSLENIDILFGSIQENPWLTNFSSSSLESLNLYFEFKENKVTAFKKHKQLIK